LSEAMTEEGVQQLVMAYQQYQAEAETLARQLSLSQMTMEELSRAVNTIEAIEKADPGQVMMVPIGSGSFLHATLASTSVVLNVGAGVSIEKPPAEAKEALTARKADVAAGSKKIADLMDKIRQEMEKIEGILQKAEAARGEGFV